MRFLPPALHRFLDFVTVAAFALAPSVLGLTGLGAALAYILAAVHLAMTLLTRFASTGRGPIPLALHGTVELLVGAALLALPWLARSDGAFRPFYICAGLVILAVWAFSRYGAPAAREAA